MNKSKLMVSLLACVSAVAMGSCAKAPEFTAYDESKHGEISKQVYDAQLGDFDSVYQKSQKASSVSEKYALEAIAEAKLYESGAFLPTTSKGGNYAISRVAPKSVNTTLWGTDEYRYSTAIVTEELQTKADRDALKAIWKEEAAKENGDYTTAAKNYLTGKGYHISKKYSYQYTSDNKTFDILASSKQVDSEVLVNCVDGLLVYNQLNNQVPALAESYEISADKKTYTFHIRDAQWVDYQGRKVDDVKADDWVAGLQHMTDADAGLDWLITGIVKGYTEYVEGTDKDFSHVGIKAVDAKTLTIELEEPTDYFLTMLGYSCFEPLCRSYYEANGGKFGDDFDSKATTYLYGKDFQHIPYCGAYRITGWTSNSKITFTQNDSYWNKAGVNVEELEFVYNDGTDVNKGYDGTIAGTYSGSGLNSSSLVKCKSEGKFDTYAYVTDTDSTAYCGFWNINRAGFANFNDANAIVSTKTDAQKVAAQTALKNKNFRLACSFAIDRAAYNSFSVGEDLKYFSLTNGYTPGNFVKLSEEVTVQINGKDVTYPANTWYGQIVQDQLDADKCPIKYWDKDALSSAGFDGWYNVKNAQEYLAKAIKELKAEGVNISAKNPIYLDYPCNVSETSKNMANAVKASVEAALEGKVIVNVYPASSSDEYRNTAYYTDYGYQANYDLSTGSGWGPDYGDPKSYLDTLYGPDGYMLKTLGIY